MLHFLNFQMTRYCATTDEDYVISPYTEFWFKTVLKELQRREQDYGIPIPFETIDVNAKVHYKKATRRCKVSQVALEKEKKAVELEGQFQG